MGKALKLLHEIRRDHTAGASLLAHKGGECFLAFVKEHESALPLRFVEQLKELGNYMKEAQPAQAPLYNLVTSLQNRVLDALAKDAEIDELRRIVRGHVNAFIQSSHVAVLEIAGAAASQIKDGYTVFTHSYSSSVFAGLKQAKAADIRFHVIVTESRPVFEGREMAAELAKLGLPVSFIVDAAVTSFIAQANIVLLGADILTESYFVNKIGTFPIALVAKNYKVPVYVVSELSKCMPAKEAKDKQEERATKQVWDRAPKAVTIRNMHFEETPLTLVTGVITEQGLMRKDDIREHVKRTS